MWSISLHIQSNHSIGLPWPWPIWCTRGSYGQYMLQFGSKMPIWHLTLSDLGWPWPWLILCTRGHIINICWNMVKKIHLTFDLEWPWPWPRLILCTRVSCNQYMLKYGQKMSIWPLTLGDLGWPWPWPWLILCTRVSYDQYMLKYGQKCQFDLWPWVTLDDLDLG